MAWIAKPSSTMRVDRRSEPYLTEAMRSELTSKILPRYATKQGALLPALHMVQHEHGWIPAQAMEEIGAFLGLSAAEVLDCASFYEEYWLKPKGRHVVAVCRSIACEFCGHKQITDAVREKLGIEIGETTDDGKWTLIELECLGSCGTAPVALVDETLHENITAEQVRRLIDETRDGSHHH
ncbi:MAG: NADH-quinone oxidoreductase subunit NuoE [Phycisphaerales bacterium]|nr:NADH-quinone oxidoreductase subunit NuoE [Phycisphaerales bacterium]